MEVTLSGCLKEQVCYGRLLSGQGPDWKSHSCWDENCGDSLAAKDA